MTIMPVYRYRAVVLSNHDGDTLTVDIDLGLSTWRRKENIRLHGINCPELVAPGGRVAKSFTTAWLAAAVKVVIDTKISKDATEKYGRLLGVVWRDSDPVSLNDALLASGNAVPFMV